MPTLICYELSELKLIESYALVISSHSAIHIIENSLDAKLIIVANVRTEDSVRSWTVEEFRVRVRVRGK